MNTQLGSIITNGKTRKIIYALYAVASIAVAAAQVWFASQHLAEPSWLVGAIAVIAFLGAPVGGLAAANITATAPVVAQMPASIPVTVTPAPQTVPTPTGPSQPAAGVPPAVSSGE